MTLRRLGRPAKRWLVLLALTVLAGKVVDRTTGQPLMSVGNESIDVAGAVNRPGTPRERGAYRWPHEARKQHGHYEHARSTAAIFEP